MVALWIEVVEPLDRGRFLELAMANASKWEISNADWHGRARSNVLGTSAVRNGLWEDVVLTMDGLHRVCFLLVSKIKTEGPAVTAEPNQSRKKAI